jgi:hypothetical protein
VQQLIIGSVRKTLTNVICKTIVQLASVEANEQCMSNPVDDCTVSQC